MSAQRGKRSALPRMADLAAQLREGPHTLAELAETYRVTYPWLAQRLNRAGWDTEGEVIRFVPPAPERVAEFTRPDLSWMDEALCAQTDPAAFFPESGVVPTRAKRVCQACPVRQECLEYAITTGDTNGMYAGLPERQRAQYVRGAAE